MSFEEHAVLRLAASNYSNSAPLIWSFWHGAQREKVVYLPDAAPSKCAEMLRLERVEIALTPVIEYQRINKTLIVPDCCVASKQLVKSVILVTKGDELRLAKTVALDVSSKTSVALTQIIFREFFRHEPEWIAHEPNIEKMLKTCDAALLIGDPALNLDRNKFRVFDIVQLWREFTGHGFVFAFWLVRASAAKQARTIDFAGARDEGLEKIEEIMRYYQARVNLTAADFRSYLTQNISYSLDEELKSGLQLYYQLALKLGLIKNSKELTFI